jgi:hypothetical protein
MYVSNGLNRDDRQPLPTVAGLVAELGTASLPEKLSALTGRDSNSRWRGQEAGSRPEVVFVLYRNLLSVSRFQIRSIEP